MEHRDTEIRQKQIVAAVRKLIINRGGEHLTIKRIAEEVGISQGAIYRHFKSKRDILLVLADEVERTLLGDLANNHSIDSAPLDVLDAAFKRHLSAIEQRRGISFQIIAEIIAFGDKELNQTVFDSLTRYMDRMVEILSNGVKSGEIRSDIDLKATSMMLFGIIQGLVNIWALGNYNFNLNEKYITVWNLFRENVRKH